MGKEAEEIGMIGRQEMSAGYLAQTAFGLGKENDRIGLTVHHPCEHSDALQANYTAGATPAEVNLRALELKGK